MNTFKLKGELRRNVPDEGDKLDGITFDKLGRMKYHPEFHFNHGKPFTLDEKIYLTKYYELDGPRAIGFALGRTEHTVMNIVCNMRKSGEWKRYASLSDDEWLSITEGAEAV
ncbi:hypothetical protein K0T92_14360 [Paenibacillus oenotherae]|uniref:DNA-entry nuclease n=1 Tax=Paenibacillus oenotherae TaxID=1435645 RepID=A0ABS7D7L0_9BACL|nr:hypothetical protein [Paenibacillus oenotherae]MBW7475925.1 hypothetical protein [Paenibacillus oenotherae]